MSQIDVKTLTFSYEGSYDNIFENASFTIDTDWKLGLIGRNGRGKTTLLNLLMGKFAYSGTISKSVEFEYFPYAVPDESLPAGAVLSGAAPGCPGWMIARELSLLEMDEDTLKRPFRTLSNGERTKLLLAALFLRDCCYLLIDEPTNHLDMAARQSVSEYLKSKSGYILVSHDRAFLDNCVDHILSINRADIEVQKGNFSSWWENKRARDEAEQSLNLRLRQDIKRLHAAAARTASFSEKTESAKYGKGASGLKPDRGYIGHKAAKMAKRAKNLENRKNAAAEEKAGLLKNIEETGRLKIFPLSHPKKTLLELRDISVSYGGREVCGGVELRLEQGERVALSGKNGSGKSSVLKLVCGEPLEFRGTLSKASGLIISYAGQDASGVCGSLADYANSYGADKTLFFAILRKLGFERLQFEKDMADLSAGQKKKALIARSLCQRAHLYIWDEPLNYIDVFSRIQIEQLILSYRPTMLFVEHDGEFCRRVATRRISL